VLHSGNTAELHERRRDAFNRLGRSRVADYLAHVLAGEPVPTAKLGLARVWRLMVPQVG